ncbi:unnamed protein product, partial [Durusdinium trenchii]
VTKDLAYFFNVEVCSNAAEEERLLQIYHKELSERLRSLGDPVPDLEQFRTSLELALCDWRRFSEIGLGGWGDSSATKRVMKVLERLDHGKALASEEAYIAAMQKEFPA